MILNETWTSREADNINNTCCQGKENKGAKMPFLNSAHAVKTACDIRLQNSPYRSHRTSTWVNECTSLILNTYELLVQQSRSSNSPTDSSFPLEGTYFNGFRATAGRQISQTCGNLEHESGGSHCLWAKLPKENDFLPVIYWIIYGWRKPYFTYLKDI